MSHQWCFSSPHLGHESTIRDACHVDSCHVWGDGKQIVLMFVLVQGVQGTSHQPMSTHPFFLFITSWGGARNKWRLKSMLLVVSTRLKKYLSVGMIVPNIWKNKNVPSHEPVWIYNDIYIQYIDIMILHWYLTTKHTWIDSNLKSQQSLQDFAPNSHPSSHWVILWLKSRYGGEPARIFIHS